MVLPLIASVNLGQQEADALIVRWVEPEHPLEDRRRLLMAAKGFLTDHARKDFVPGFAKWAGRFRNAGGGLKEAMERELMNAQLYGWDQRTLAGRFVDIPEFSFKNLPKIDEQGRNIFTMGGKLGDSDALLRRAHMIARTELNGVAERMHETWTQEAGFTKYINLNSDPVAAECIAANMKPPMTLEEWDASLGRPPRHPNCDSGLMAVPPESVAEVTAEIKVDADRHAARAA